MLKRDIGKIGDSTSMVTGSQCKMENREIVAIDNMVNQRPIYQGKRGTNKTIKDRYSGTIVVLVT